MNLNVIPLICKEVNENIVGSFDLIGVSDTIFIDKSKPSYFTIGLFLNGVVKEELFVHIMLESVNNDGGRYLGNYNVTADLKASDLESRNIVIDNRFFTKVDSTFPDSVDKVIFKIFIVSKHSMDEINSLHPNLSDFDKFNKLGENNKLELKSIFMANIVRN